MARTLDVYLHETLAGQLQQEELGQMSFQYAEAWLDRPRAVPLSQSLPLRRERYRSKECRPYFTGILPEGAKRERIARNLGISIRNDFVLLMEMGGECPGAVTLLPPEVRLPAPDFGYRDLSQQDLAMILRGLPKRPLLAGEKAIRLSLAGAQDKIPLRLKDDMVRLPLGGAPSTHILKPAPERFEGLVFNEALCLKLAAAAGLPVAAVETRAVEGVDYLQVERFDRKLRAEPEGGVTLERLHQEDFCQALGMVSERKYQKEGGPSLKQCFELLRRVSSAPVLDLARLLDAVIFNYLAGNGDAHGKNFSLLYRGGAAVDREIRLAPLYDVVSTVFYVESHDMAMKIGREYLPEKVAPGDFDQLAEEAGLARPMVRRRVAEVADRVLTALGTVEIAEGVAARVATAIRHRSEITRKRFKR